MNAAALRDKLDDLLNPIVVKELRQAVRSRVLVAAITLFLVILLAILFFNLSVEEPRNTANNSLYAGRRIFLVLQGILLGACMVLIPAYAGIRLSSEHSETNVDLLFISTLRPRGIIAGKLQASIVLMLLIFSTCAPFMTFTYLLRGIDIPSIVLVLALDFLVVLFSTQAAIFLGAIPANIGLRLFLGFIGVVALIYLFIGAMAASFGLLELGLGSLMDTLDFWLAVGGAVIFLVASIGLFFTWSVAIISSPSANRAFPVRLYFLAYWLVTGSVAGYLSYRSHELFWFLLWAYTIAGLLCLQLLVAINEREQWGLRILRTIPRHGWLRIPAFLLYSGSAGGVLFAAGLIAATAGLTAWALADGSGIFSSVSSFRFDTYFREAAAIGFIALYTFNYSLSAVWLRNVLLADRIKPSLTWVVALLLFAIGFALPLLLVFLFQSEEMRMGRVDPWWYITNPFATVLTILESHSAETNDFLTGAAVFLCLWGLGMVVANMGWFVRQIRRFHPPLTVSAEKP